VQNGSITKVIAAGVLGLFLAGCKPGPPKAPVIGEAFVGPAVLKIRSDFPLQSATVATVKHGDRLQILQVRRKFLRVRTPSGAEGWTDERQLLAASDMAALRDLGQRAAKMPSQGLATTFSPVNIHTQPVLSSPSFLQLKENEKIHVLRSVLFPRTDAPARAPLVPRTPKKKPEPKKKKKESKYPLPPMPKPPPAPEDWLDLSKPELDDDGETTDAAAEKPPPKIDSWSLVRTPQGQAGWVLTRMLSMAIPDEVAQYAEGKRIVSYFALGEIQDGDTRKPIWLWTTAGSREAWDFDSFRVFVWSLRRHRYETAHIERNLHGYAPVLLKDVSYASRAESGKYPGFSVCVENKEGQRMRREYVMIGNAVRFASEQPCEPPAPPLEIKPAAPLPVASETAPPASTPGPGLWERLKLRFRSIRGK
jgi:hypothetical protein